MMTYKGYTAEVEFDPEADFFHGRVLDLTDVITFQGRSVEELHREFAASVDDYLAFCAERGEPPQKPYSGTFLVRADAALHRQIAMAARRAGASVNSWVVQALRDAVAKRGPSAAGSADEEAAFRVA